MLPVRIRGPASGLALLAAAVSGSGGAAGAVADARFGVSMRIVDSCGTVTGPAGAVRLRCASPYALSSEGVVSDAALLRVVVTF